MEYMFSISFRKHCDKKKENNLLTLHDYQNLLYGYNSTHALIGC